MKKFAVLLALTVSCVAQAEDLGFRFKNGQCVNSKGEKGLNTGFIGQCANLDRVTIANFDFGQTDLSGSSIQSADLQRSNMVGANLTAVNFSGTDLSGVDFYQAKLHGTVFSNSVLINAHLAGADIKDAWFDNVDLSGSVLTYQKFPGCSFANANFSEANLEQVEFSGANLQGGIFKRAKLGQAVLEGANLDKSNLSEADLRSAKLNKVSMKNSDLRKAQFESADLSNANLTGSDARKTVFTNANLSGTKLQQVKFNKHTLLPFTQEDAIGKGMVMAASGRILIILDNDDARDSKGVKDLKTFLDNEGGEYEISKMLHQSFSATVEELKDFTTILDNVGTQYEDDMPTDGQEAIASVVKNGGTYIVTQLSGHSADSHGYLEKIDGMILMGNGTEEKNTQDFTISSGKENDPLLSGVTKLKAVHTYYAANLRFSADTEVLVQDSDSNPMVVRRKMNQGRAIGLAFFPYFNMDYLEEPAIQRLILNSME